MLVDIINPMVLTAVGPDWGCVSFARPYDLKLVSIGERLKAVRPTTFLGVPRVWEKMEAKMKAWERMNTYSTLHLHIHELPPPMPAPRPLQPQWAAMEAALLISPPPPSPPQPPPSPPPPPFYEAARDTCDGGNMKCS